VTPYRPFSVQPHKRLDTEYPDSVVLTYQYGPHMCGSNDATNQSASLWTSVYHSITFKTLDALSTSFRQHSAQPNLLHIRLHNSQLWNVDHEVSNLITKQTIRRTWTFLSNSIVILPFNMPFHAFLNAHCAFSQHNANRLPTDHNFPFLPVLVANFVSSV
jgi:hypothetical protein